MEYIKIERKNNYALLKLDRGKSNPINQQVVTEFNSALQQLLDDATVLGTIICGKENFFSAGLDIPELFEYDRPTFSVFWQDFMQLMLNLAQFDKPLIAAITGHAPAGGCIIANGCDYRVMADGNYKIGLNEIPVGIVVPRSVYLQYAQWIGRRNAYQYLMEGKLILPNEAFSIGLIDEVVPIDKVVEHAENKLQHYLQFEQQGWRTTKRQLRYHIIEEYKSITKEEMTIFENQWWSPQVRAGLNHFIEKLQKR